MSNQAKENAQDWMYMGVCDEKENRKTENTGVRTGCGCGVCDGAGGDWYGMGCR